MVNNKIAYFGVAILIVIFVFAFIYCGISSVIKGVDGFGSALYFSVVTITTLGFGDMYPVSQFGKIIVCLEALSGVVIVGLFLNTISNQQAQKINLQEKERNKYERYLDAKAKLRQNYLLMARLFEKYLQAAFFVTTPSDRRRMPEDIFRYDFRFSFNDMADLYEPPQLLIHQFNISAVEIYFDIHDRLYQELRHIVDNVDLSYWPSLESNIHSFIQQCSDFFYKDGIIHNALIVPDGIGGHNLRDDIQKLIHDHEGEFSLAPNDLKTPYVSLYNMLFANTRLVQQIAAEMSQESESDT